MAIRCRQAVKTTVPRPRREQDRGVGRSRVRACVLCCAVAAAMPASASAVPGVSAADQAKLQRDFEAMRARQQQLTARGIADSYAAMRVRLVERFLGYLAIDVKNNRSRLASYAARDLGRLIGAETSRIDSILAGRTDPAVSPRLVPDEKPRIVSGHLVQRVRWPNGRIETRPVFLFGFGAFAGVRRDIEWLGALGANYSQTEMGPRRTMPKPGVWSDKRIEGYRRFAQRAHGAGVLIDLLISPHYMPKWAMKQNPSWNVHLGGFIKYAINRPGVKKLLGESTERMLRELSPEPALWSVCLANEPAAFRWTRDKDTRPMWNAFLKDRYKNIGALNRRWGTDHESWDAVPAYRTPPRRPYQPLPGLYDWMRFNDSRLADWLAWLDSRAKRGAPDRITHVKMLHRHFSQFDLLQGVDIARFGLLGDVNGMDGGHSPADPEASPRRAIDAGYVTGTNVMLRGVRNRPIFNTENHMLRDRGINDVYPGHVRATLWLQALSGMSASAAWAWDRADDRPKQPFVGLFQYRPGATEEYIRTGLDLMRLMPKVTAIAEAPPEVALLYSRTAMLRNHTAPGPFLRAFEALNGIGVPVTVVTEQALAAGRARAVHPSLKVLVIAGATHLPDDAFAGLEQFLVEGFVDKTAACIVVGPDVAGRNEYDRPRPLRLFEDTGVALVRLPSADAKDFRRRLTESLAGLGVAPEYRLVEAAGREPLPEVYFRAARTDKGVVASAVNTLTTPVKCYWADSRGREMVFHDECRLVSSGERTIFELRPLQVVCGPLASPSR